MEKIEVTRLNVSQTVDREDLLMTFSKKSNQLSLVPVDFVAGNGGYACRRWNINHASPVGEAVGNLDYLRNLPGMLGLGCYLVDKNHGRRKLDPTNHYKFVGGEPAKLDGSMGEYMWGWGCTWYYAEWTEGDYYYEAASLKPIPGRMNYRIPVASTSALGVSVVDRTTNELVSVINNSARYRGGNNDPSLDSKFNTQLGRAATSLNAETFGSYARKKGDGWEGYWYAHAAIIGALTRIILGTRDIQQAFNASKDKNGLYQGGLGAGISGAGSWWGEQYKYYPFIPTDAGVDLADKCGTASIAVKGPSGTLQTVSVPCFFGLKNFYGYMGRWERGRLINKVAGGAADIYVLPRLYSSYSMNSLAGMVKAGQAPAAKIASQWEYTKVLSMHHLAHIPVLTGGTSSTYYADGYYNDNAASGLRVPYVGGNAGAGGNDGCEYLSVSAGVAASFASYGSPLCEAAEDWDTTPFLVSA